MAKKASSRKKAAPKSVYPTCVRHLKPRKDVRVRNYFLCDKCTKEWTKEAFDGHRPKFVGEAVDGYCLLCNKSSENIKLRSWMLCDICDRVAKSIGRNHVAEASIIAYWNNSIRTKFPSLEIVQNDKSSLRPRRDTDTKADAPIDFLIQNAESGANLFGIENKTGRSSIREMSQFQLDISDCDTILNDMANLGIPAFIVHAQVLEIWKPPTNGFVIQSLWWTDVYRMTEHFKSIRQRRDEMRGAAYFGKKAFEPMDTFADNLFDGGGNIAIIDRYQAEGAPTMYTIEEG